MKKIKDRVLKAIWKTDNKYKYIIAISANEEENQTDIDYNLKHYISFVLLYESKRKYVEWIPKYGPITIITESTNEDDEPRREDYIFEFSKGRGEWMQSVCSDERLNQAFIEGNYEHIFNVMKRFL